MCSTPTRETERGMKERRQAESKREIHHNRGETYRIIETERQRWGDVDREEINIFAISKYA